MLIYSLGIVRGFREEELPSIFNCMKIAIQLSKVSAVDLWYFFEANIILLCSHYFQVYPLLGFYSALLYK
jgi:hypothetical protein